MVPTLLNTLAFPLILIAEVCSVNWAIIISPLSNFSEWWNLVSEPRKTADGNPVSRPE